MRVKSPLSNLSETINQIKESAAQYRTTLQGSEAATRVVLIDPILQALGWDTANINMVAVEKWLNQSRVDYALYDENAKVSLIVEAKQLGENLNDPAFRNNIVKYAYNFETTQIFLTDGLIWQYMKIGGPGDISFANTNFLEDNVVDCAAFLVERLDAARFWPKEETIDELAQRIGQLESDLATLQKEITYLKSQSSQSDTLVTSLSPLTTTATTPLGPPSTSNKTEEAIFIDLANVSNITNTTPSLLRLPDGTTLTVRRWKNVLVECCKFALSTNDNISIPFSDQAGGSRQLINWQPPKEGQTFVEEQYRGRKIFIYTNYSARETVANAHHVLRQVPESFRKVRPGIVYS